MGSDDHSPTSRMCSQAGRGPGKRVSGEVGTPVRNLLDRLDGVRNAGRGWVARCPAHDDRSPSLAIDVGKDGETVLLHCFAGCETVQVVSALGIAMADLFPRGSSIPRTGRERFDPRVAFLAAMEVVRCEVAIVQIAVGDLARGKELGLEDRDRLEVAAARIEAAWETIRECR